MSNQQRLQSLVEAREVFQAARTGSLSVLDFDTGGPLSALVNVAVTAACAPIILTSKLSRHTQCLDRDGRAAILVTGELPANGDALTGFRASLTGCFSRTDDAAIRNRYLEQHPYAEQYASYSDFGFWIMQPQKLYVVAGFGRVYNYEAAELAG